MAQFDNGQDFPLDPLEYIGLAKRDENGRIRCLEVFYEGDVIHIEGGEEFITFKTRVLLEDS